MKIFFLSFSLMLSAAAFAQPMVVTNAVISTTTNVVAPDEEDVSQIQNQGGGGFNFRNMMDGETKTTTYVKDSLVKTSFKSETFRGSIYRDNTAKTTTTVFEIMGNKQGFTASDDDQVQMMKKADSMMEERAKTDTSMQQRRPRNTEKSPVMVAYNTNETKKIAGYNCQRAYIITQRLLGKDSAAVWFTPEIRFPNLSSTGGTSGLGNMMGGSNHFELIDGFVMAYERDMPRGRKMEVKVTKIETDKEVAAKEFEIPKDVEIKTMKEMQQGGGGGFRMFGRP